MADQIFIGTSGGQKTDRTAFNIDNNSFPLLYNFYAWRGRVKKKRGTLPLGRLAVQIQIVSTGALPWQYGPITLSVGAANLITALSLESSSTIVPGTISFIVGGQTYTDPSTPDGTLTGSGGGTGTINYATGAVTITGGGSSTLTGFFDYYPGLPVMGLRDFVKLSSPSSTVNPLYPLLLTFDTTYSYQINQGGSPLFYNVNYYKTTNNPFIWNGQDYQQFWTTNYSGALWATNGNPGFHFQNISIITEQNPTKIQTASPHGLITGDWVFFNEITGANASSLNLQAFQITRLNSTQFTVPVDTTGETLNNNGIFQMLTSALSGQDGIRWYDGDPTGATGLPTGTGLGWVNFAPPLTAVGTSIENTPFGIYYLVGCLMIVPFKDRLLFLNPVIQTSTGGPITLQDVVIWSWNGTPYYNALVPINQTYDVTAYYVDQAGKGGYLSAGLAQPIITVSNNEDVLIIGFGGDGRKTRFVYSGNDLQPFLFFTINSELPSSATFSSITLDRGAIDIGQYGIAMTDQQSSQRIDLDIPDSVFQIQSLNFGVQRVNAIRDFFREWIYFSFPYNDSSWKFPTRTFLFNYRDNTWAVFYENYTSHGRYRPQSKKSWLTLGYSSWLAWRAPWNSGSNSPLFTDIIVGNPQGYVLIKDGDSTSEAPSGTIQAISNSGGFTQITSINHCVEVGDYIYIQGCLGTTALNGIIAIVTNTGTRASPTANTFTIDASFPSGTYLGLGTFTRLCQPILQTKQFPFYWEQGKQLRLALQKYLLDTTSIGQVTLNIYLSQDSTNAWNDPLNSGTPNGLVYSQLLYTCPESTNLGLTPANTNLQMPTASTQEQIWHRFNASMIGDSVQIGITLSDAQMRNLTYATSEITLHGIQLTIHPGPHLA